ncbi:Os12g0581950 [Oryza sativa Japonica Group]|uniref:Os12g0581950 protein n=1 Tax=Oryza sativa subsp. japonica TaxID=39947 RepID=A0A0P0YBR4_ORYSJ|nr:hypothetical protein EE612_060528 [Oryza sativa]BAT17827.1 Os12g0581950 [Oryza sativa Japonica Group]
MQKLHENTLCGAEEGLGASDSEQFAASVSSASAVASSGDPCVARVRLSHVAPSSSCSLVSCCCSELSLFTDDSSACSISYHVSGSSFLALRFATHVWCIFFQFSDGFYKG